MAIIGLTGGIGSGKTTVARIFETMNIPVYYTDTEAKRIMAESPAVKAKLTERFGNDVYEEGQPDKSRLAELIFGNEENLAYVNSVVHPEVRKDFLNWARQRIAYPWVVVESAILFESGLARIVDKTVTVTAPLEKKIERVMQRDRTGREQVLGRIAAQLPDEEKIKQSDAVIINDGIQPLIPQVQELISCGE